MRIYLLAIWKKSGGHWWWSYKYWDDYILISTSTYLFRGIQAYVTTNMLAVPSHVFVQAVMLELMLKIHCNRFRWYWISTRSHSLTLPPCFIIKQADIQTNIKNQAAIGLLLHIHIRTVVPSEEATSYFHKLQHIWDLAYPIRKSLQLRSW